MCRVVVDVFNYADGRVFEYSSVTDLSAEAILVAAGLGFCLSLLFFMDQNISAAMVASPENRSVPRRRGRQSREQVRDTPPWSPVPRTGQCHTAMVASPENRSVSRRHGRHSRKQVSVTPP